MSSVAANVEGAAERTLGDILPPWWLLLITGVGWSLVGLILLRFNYTSVHAISLLFGFVGIAAGVMEHLHASSWSAAGGSCSTACWRPPSSWPVS